MRAIDCQTVYRTRLENFRHAPGIFKIDYACLTDTVEREAGRRADGSSGRNDDELPRLSATSPLEKFRNAICSGRAQSLFDKTRRARTGKHTLWAYCHVPFDSKIDMSERIEFQIEPLRSGFSRLHSGA